MLLITCRLFIVFFSLSCLSFLIFLFHFKLQNSFILSTVMKNTDFKHHISIFMHWAKCLINPVFKKNLVIQHHTHVNNRIPWWTTKEWFFFPSLPFLFSHSLASLEKHNMEGLWIFLKYFFSPIVTEMFCLSDELMSLDVGLPTSSWNSFSTTSTDEFPTSCFSGFLTEQRCCKII